METRSAVDVGSGTGVHMTAWAAPWLGLLGGSLMFLCGVTYLNPEPGGKFRLGC